MSSGPPSDLHLLSARWQWLRRTALAGMAGLPGAGCSPPPLRIGAHPWPGDVRMVPLVVDGHANALCSSKVDAVVTFDPARAQLSPAPPPDAVLAEARFLPAL